MSRKFLLSLTYTFVRIFLDVCVKTNQRSSKRPNHYLHPPIKNKQKATHTDWRAPRNPMPRSCPRSSRPPPALPPPGRRPPPSPSPTTAPGTAAPAPWPRSPPAPAASSAPPGPPSPSAVPRSGCTWRSCSPATCSTSCGPSGRRRRRGCGSGRTSGCAGN